MDISVVIVTWNAKRIVQECLDSLKEYQGNPNVEIIVVDNASSDGTPEIIGKQFPFIRLLQNNRNAGFAGGNNIGIKLASGKYVALVNSDVVVPSGCFEKIYSYMEQHADVGMLGPKMLLPDGTIGQSCMRFPSLTNWFIRALALDSIFARWKLFGGFLMTDFSYDKITDVDVLTGWFWVIRKTALDQVGLLDEEFFMYGEDIDWSKRFHNAGWRVVFYPEAEALHYTAASSSKAPTRFYVEMNRANMQYCQRYHNGFAVILFWVATCLHELIRILGYGVICMLRAGKNSTAYSKVKRSVACFLWLVGFRGVQKYGGR